MIYILAVLLIIIILLPFLWVKYTVARYSKDTDYIPGTGAQFVKHLSDKYGIENLQTEICENGNDHYSPHENIIRLSPALYNGKSVSSLAIAAHEFGHALQYSNQEQITLLRQRYTPVAHLIEKLSIGLISITPIIIAIFKLPQLGIISIAAAIVSLLVSIILQLIILPMEWDASFQKALPILIEGEYLAEEDIPKARKILRAAALTYFAATLSSLLNIWRWIRILRR